MPPSTICPLSGRYLSFAEREEIALLRAQGLGVRAVAERTSFVSPELMIREVRSTSVPIAELLRPRISSDAILAVECTVGALQTGKADKLVARTSQLQSAIPKERLMPVLISARSTAELSASERAKAVRDGVHLLTREGLARLEEIFRHSSRISGRCPCTVRARANVKPDGFRSVEDDVYLACWQHKREVE